MYSSLSHFHDSRLPPPKKKTKQKTKNKNNGEFVLYISDPTVPSKNQTTMSIQDLDSFTLIKIFSYLTAEDIALSVRLTCKRWQEISRDPQLWKTVWNEREADWIRRLSDDFNGWPLDTRPLKLHVLKANVPCFESLIIDYDIALLIEGMVSQGRKAHDSENTNFKIKSLCRKYPNINKFPSRFSKLDDGNLPLLKLHNVKYLYLVYRIISGCGVGMTFPFEKSNMRIKEFIQNQPTLEVFDTDFTLNTSTLDLLLESPNLRSIEISTKIPSIASNLNRHSTLSLQEIRLHGSKIQDLHVKTLCDNVKHLRNLGIFRCSNISDEAFSKISQCNELDTLSIGHCKSLSEDVYVKHVSACSWIQKICINTNGQYDVFSSFAGEKYPIHGRSSDYSYDVKLTMMSNAGLHALASDCRGLRELHLSKCEHITDLGVMSVADHCPQLEILDLSGCQNVTDFSLLALAEQSHGLQTLLLNECFHVTQVGIGPLIAKCRNLRKLGLSFAGYLHNLNLNQFLALPGRFSEFVPSHDVAAFGDHAVPVDQGQGDIICPCLRKQGENKYDFCFINKYDFCSISERVPAEHKRGRCSKLANITNPRNFREMYRGLNGTQHSKAQKNDTSVVEDNTNSIDGRADKMNHVKEGDQILSNQTQDGLKSPRRVDIDRKISSARVSFLSCLSDPSLPSARQHSNITHLNLQYCASLDDYSLDQIVFHCPDLRILDIEGCPKITDASLYSIARNSHVLKTLHMPKLPLCSKEGLMQLINSSDYLEKIHISVDSNTRLTAADIKDLNGRKSAKGKYISVAGSGKELKLLSDAEYNRTLHKPKHKQKGFAKRYIY